MGELAPLYNGGQRSDFWSAVRGGGAGLGAGHEGSKDRC